MVPKILSPGLTLISLLSVVMLLRQQFQLATAHCFP